MVEGGIIGCAIEALQAADLGAAQTGTFVSTFDPRVIMLSNCIHPTTSTPFNVLVFGADLNAACHGVFALVLAFACSFYGL